MAYAAASTPLRSRCRHTVKSRYRWYAAAVFFMFMLLHQADKLLIGPLTSSIMADFQINEAQIGAVSSLAIVVASLLYPVWGYLYDRYARPKLLALASFIWGATTWLNALAPMYPDFLVTHSTTGIDDSSYPEVFSLLSDYFPPSARGKVYDFVRVSGPLGFMIGTVLATMLGGSLGSAPGDLRRVHPGHRAALSWVGDRSADRAGGLGAGELPPLALGA